jgi:hypothetical protein
MIYIKVVLVTITLLLLFSFVRDLVAIKRKDGR